MALGYGLLVQVGDGALQVSDLSLKPGQPLLGVIPYEAASAHQVLEPITASRRLNRLCMVSSRADSTDLA